jgi:glycosyltransferase involved in cell wall biosynthesis
LAEIDGSCCYDAFAARAWCPKRAEIAGMKSSIAVLIPCYNEALTINGVVTDFARELPQARVYVFDNNSSDDTGPKAAAAGAIVVPEARQGKGYVMASMLSQIDADIYVLVDGDATYPPASVHDLLQPVLGQRADHVVGARRAVDGAKAYRRFHTAGNRLVTFLVNRIFGTRLEDVMSGYRVFTRDVALHVPLLSGGFDVETEFTLQTLEKGFVIAEIPVSYQERPAGSFSKLATYRDGARVLLRVATILKDFRPFAFFGGLAAFIAILSLAAGYQPIADYVREKYVYHVPLAILAAVLGAISVGLLQTGIILTTMNARFRELHVLRRRGRSRREAESDRARE